MKENKGFWARSYVVLLTATFCAFLWGSAPICIKIGYRLMQVDRSDVPSQMLFSGIRFTIAGIMVLAAGSLLEKRPLIPGRRSAGPIAVLALFQTFLQYFFYYIGVAHSTGVLISIFASLGTFITIIIAVFVFHYEDLTARKVTGCILGCIGAFIIATGGKGFGVQFSLLGEGCLILSNTSSALAANFIKLFGKKEDPVMLSGCQFTAGGLVLLAAGAAAGGHISVSGAGTCILILYMGFISAAAYTLWGILLKHNAVSRVSVFGFLNPVFGVLLSAFVLGEESIAFSAYGIISVLFVTAGVIVVFSHGSERQRS